MDNHLAIKTFSPDEFRIGPQGLADLAANGARIYLDGSGLSGTSLTISMIVPDDKEVPEKPEA